MPPGLLDQILPEHEIGSVIADGAYDTRKCHDSSADRDAAAVIPPRKNAKPWKPNTPRGARTKQSLADVKIFWAGALAKLGPSRFESKMRCVKLLGQRLLARDFDRQVVEIQIRIAVMNGCTALGIHLTEAVGSVPVWGTLDRQPMRNGLLRAGSTSPESNDLKGRVDSGDRDSARADRKRRVVGASRW